MTQPSDKAMQADLPHLKVSLNEKGRLATIRVDADYQSGGLGEVIARDVEPAWANEIVRRCNADAHTQAAVREATEPLVEALESIANYSPASDAFFIIQEADIALAAHKEGATT